MYFTKTNREISLKEFKLKFLPENHTDQDVKYLEARYKWETAKVDPETRSELFSVASELYQGTTFQRNNQNNK